MKKQTEKERLNGNVTSNKEPRVFPGSSTPIEYLFLYLSQGKTYKEFLATYKRVKEEDVLAVIEAAQIFTCRDEFRLWQEVIALRGDIKKLSRNTGAAFEQLGEIVEDGFERRDTDTQTK